MIPTKRFPAPAAVPTALGIRLLWALMVMLLLAAPPLFAQQRTNGTRSHEQEREARKSERDSVRQHPDGSRDSTTADPKALTLYTSDGSGKLRFKSEDGDFRGRIGGRIMFDNTIGSVGDDVEPDVGSMEDGTEFRRARLFTEGVLYDIGYKFQIDFAGEPSIEDMYLAFPSPVPNANVKVGKFKEDISLVELTSSKYITFMARPMLTEFTGGRDLGVRLGGDAVGGDLNYGIGLYRDKTDDALGTSQGDGNYKGAGRVAYVPWRTDEKRKLIHVGASGSIASLDSGLSPADQPQEAHEPEVHLAPDFVDTGPIDAKRTTRLGLESALVYNAFSVQAEYLQKKYSRDTGGSDPTFGSWYIFGSYFLTGEHRPYDGGNFGRVAPHENVRAGDNGGPGAVEIAARYSTMDLTDSGIVGGEVETVTLGVNWYLNPSVRVMANYVLAAVDDAAGTAGVDGEGHFFTTRVQLDF